MFYLVKKKSEEKEAIFVRGKTWPNGMIVEVWTTYSIDWEKDIDSFQEDASFGHYDYWRGPLSDLLSQKRIVNFSEHRGDFSLLGSMVASRHESISKVFKSDLYVSITEKDFRSWGFDSVKIHRLGYYLWRPYLVKIYIVSDGEKCYVKAISTPQDIERDYLEAFPDEKTWKSFNRERLISAREKGGVL